MINLQLKTTISDTGSRPSRPVNKRKRKDEGTMSFMWNHNSLTERPAEAAQELIDSEEDEGTAWIWFHTHSFINTVEEPKKLQRIEPENADDSDDEEDEGAAWIWHTYSLIH